MNLIALHQTPRLCAYHDSWNNWLFLDWHGELTLPDVQEACLALLRCCCAHPYQRVLNSNAQVTGLTGSVLAWVGREFLPHLQQLGVEQMAWVRAPLPAGQQLVQLALASPALALRIAAFDEVDGALEWLQHTQPERRPDTLGPRLQPPGRRAQIAACAEQVIARVEAQLA